MKNFQNKPSDLDSKNFQKEVPTVEDYMAKDLITFKKDTDINVVINSLLENQITGAPVLDNQGKVVGLIDDKDCLNLLFGNVYNRLPNTADTVSRYMSNVMKSINVNQNILEAATVFVTTPYKRLLVLDDDDNLVGQISRRDILRAIKELA